MDKRLIHEQLLNEHRRLINEIADIKSQSITLTPEQENQVSILENRVRIIAEKLYKLYQ